MIKLLYFGRFRDVADNTDIDLPAGVSDSKALTAWLSSHVNAFEAEWQRAGARMAINKTVVNDMETHPIADGDEIAFMSALSGG